jgi:hypothetical protein
MTQVVDGGLRILSQTPYALTVPTPYPGWHPIDVWFAGLTVTFAMKPGTRVRGYASGKVEPY